MILQRTQVKAERAAPPASLKALKRGETIQRHQRDTEFILLSEEEVKT